MGDVVVEIADNAKVMPDVDGAEWFAGELKPASGITCAEMAVVLMRFIGGLYA